MAKEPRRRRTKAELDKIGMAMHALLAADHPMTVRQVFYQMVSRGIVGKTENEYKNSVGRLLLKLRRSGDIPYAWIADNTRWMRKPRTYSCVEDAVLELARTYRASLWDNQSDFVEIWTEKDALAGVLAKETMPYDVPLMVSRGFSSDTFLYEAAEEIKAADRPAHLYYFGDHDPSGVFIDRSIESRLRVFAPDAEIHFTRLAVTHEQIERLSLPTRPTKKKDSRAKNFEGESVEVDAIPPATLRAMVRECIERHIDQHALAVARVAERNGRDMLQAHAKLFGIGPAA